MAETLAGGARAPLTLLLAVELVGMGALVLAVVLARPALVPVAVAAVAIPEGASLALAGPTALAPILGAALLAGSELAFWSIEWAVPARESVGVGVVRTLRLAGMCLIGATAGLAISAASGVPIAGGFDLTALGILATLGVLVAFIWLGRVALRAQSSR